MPKSLVQIGYNPVTAKLYGADDEVRLIVSTALSYHVEGYEFTEAHKSRGWDGRSTMFNWNAGTFPRGFVDEIESILIAHGYAVQRVCKPLPLPEGPIDPVVDTFGNDKRYDYQMETVRQLEQRGVMIARIATGGGKSRITKLATARINRPTLFVTTRKSLMYQMKRSFETSGFEVGVMGDGEWEPNKHLNVAMIQTLVTRLKEPEKGDNSADAMRQHRLRTRTIEYLSTVEFIVGEEAHEASGNSYFEVLRHCRKAEYRLALTATPFMKTAEESNMRLKAAFGSIGIEVSEEKLINRGILAKPYFKFINVPPPKGLRRGTGYARAVDIGITHNTPRNEAIVADVAMAARWGLTSMILVMRRDHGEALLAPLRAKGLRVEYIHGDKDEDQRVRALGKLQSGQLDCLIGTNILDVGVDVPAVGMVVIAGGGKAEVQLRQRIGRGLREKKTGPNVCLIVDFVDETNNHLRKHSYSRREIIEQTPGFCDNIIPFNQDFDYAALGF